MPTGERRSWTLGHRPALDGLRGLAVLLVVLAHAEVPGFRAGGVVGVTMFFVLSGFLMTSLLTEEQTQNGRLALGAFYMRRALRLLPALVVLIVFVLLVAQVLGPEVATGSDAVAALLYYGNWVRASGHDLGALSHVWSLAVEEQFYLLWPLVLIAFARRRVTLLALAVLGVVGSVLLRVYLWDDGAGFTRVYFGSDTRADAILIGAAVGLAAASGWILRAAPWVATAGVLVAVVWSVTAGSAAYVWGPLLVASLTAVAVAAVASGGAPDWLSARWLVYVGKRSYGLYLWHVPAFVLLIGSPKLDPLPWGARVVLLGGFSWAATLLSYRFVEKPALRYKQRWERSRSERAAVQVMTSSRS